MKKETIYSWCVDATKLIKFPPDRDAVREELKQHLLDKQADLKEQGVPEEEIETQAIAAMGSAEEIAPQLAAIHRPFWGYAYRVCCVILIVLLLILLPLLYMQRGNLYYSFQKPEFQDRVPGTTLCWQTTPNTKASVDNHTFTVYQVRFSKNEDPAYADDPLLSNCLSAQIKVTSPYSFSSFEAMQYVWAEDSNGNIYRSVISVPTLPSYDPEHYLVMTGWQYSFICYYRLTFMGYEDDGTQWIDLHYDRDGKSFTIRIDLTGGAAE